MEMIVNVGVKVVMLVCRLLCVIELIAGIFEGSGEPVDVALRFRVIEMVADMLFEL